MRRQHLPGDVVEQVQAYLDFHAPVEEHLADQLLISMALAGGGAFTTVAPSSHTHTNIEVIEQFLDVRFAITEGKNGDRQFFLVDARRMRPRRRERKGTRPQFSHGSSSP